MKKILFIVILTFVFLFLVILVIKPATPTIFKRAYFLITRIIVEARCQGPNKMFTTLGFFGSPFCADIFSDGGKSCDSGNECLSGICYLDFDKRKELVEKQFGRETIYRGNSDLSLIIPPKSGNCKKNTIPDCFSLGGSVKIENGKVVDDFPICD